MSPNVHGGILVLALVAGMTGESAAQETGTPVFKAPYRAFVNHEFGGSISDPGTGTDFALEGFYRYGRGANDFSRQTRRGCSSPAVESEMWTASA
jgi:hypothetical protein